MKWMEWRAGMAAAGLIAAATAYAGQVSVSVENPPGTGTVRVLLYDSPDAFADLREPLKILVVPAGVRPQADFEGLPAGQYAVMAYHDENGNRELDQNFLGIPREPLGFSRRYWGKGSPVFAAAAVDVGEEESVPVNVELKKVFGRRGLWGVGAGAIVQSSPYRGADSVRVLAIPAVTYIGERVQVLGPYGQAGLADFGPARLAATARYRMGAYEEDDSEALEGMGDRKSSLFCGLALQAPLAWGVRASAGYEHDVLDRVGGGYGRLGLRRGFQVGRISIAPSAALNGLTAELARHEYGVRPAEARDGRAEYHPDGALNPELGLGVSAEWREAWRVVLNASVEFLAEELRDSPLVDESAVFHGFFAVNYTF